MMRHICLLAATSMALAAICPPPARAAPRSTIFELKSGNNSTGNPDPLVWVQGVPVPNLGFASSGFPLQFAYVVDALSQWALIDGVRWVSPTPDAVGAPGGYEYIVFFPVPPTLTSGRLDIVWRADDVGGLHINDMPVPGASDAEYPPSRPAAEFHGDITRFLKPGMNELQFIVVNSRPNINPTGIAFDANFVLTYASGG